MPKLLCIISIWIACSDVVIFHGGCDLRTVYNIPGSCSFHELLSCDTEYKVDRIHAGGDEEFSCSAGNNYLGCLNRIIPQCKTYQMSTSYAEHMIEMINKTIDAVTNDLEVNECDAESNDARSNTSLLTVVLGLLCLFLMLRSRV